jgi:HEAT repeat protein
VIRRCLGLLAGGSDDPQFIVTLGGDHARQLLDDGVPPGQAYWLRVWAARGLLWAGPGDDVDVLRSALADDAWRVRELTCKVIARHRVGDLLDEVAGLESDPVARVRSAAARAAALIVEAGA